VVWHGEDPKFKALRAVASRAELDVHDLPGVVAPALTASAKMGWA
jgi:hypothetical protein